MPSRISTERLKRNAESLRELVNTRPQSIVRERMDSNGVSGARRKHDIPSIGTRSGKITVMGYVKGARGGLKAIIVKCDCGFPEYTIDQHNFKAFKSTRCNVCAKRASNDTRKKYWKYADIIPDDDQRARILNRISSAISRCHNPNNAHYKDYGGRGVFVSQEWRDDRVKFLKHVITLEGWDIPELEMDRRDNNRGYEAGNLRFISRSENMRNKRKVTDMQAEINDLRHRLRRAEQSLHDMDK